MASDDKLILGIDVSTNGAKALLINQNGMVVSSATSPLHLSMPHPLLSEQDPKEWWEGICSSIHQVLSRSGLSGEDVTAKAPIGNYGLLFLPYLSGERTPYPGLLASGASVDLNTLYTRAHLTRAVLEDVAFGLRDPFTLIREAGLAEINEVRISGGGAKASFDSISLPLFWVLN